MPFFSIPIPNPILLQLQLHLQLLNPIPISIQFRIQFESLATRSSSQPIAFHLIIICQVVPSGKCRVPVASAGCQFVSLSVCQPIKPPSPSACQFVAAMMVILNHNCCRPRFHYADTICMYVCICHIHIYIFYMCNELFKPGLTSISPRLPVPPSLLPLFSFALAAFVAQFR